MQSHRHTVRNIDPDLILEARKMALQSGLRLGDVINEALERYIEDFDSIAENDDYEASP